MDSIIINSVQRHKNKRLSTIHIIYKNKYYFESLLRKYISIIINKLCIACRKNKFFEGNNAYF